MKKIFKQNKGITLIALIITIIVMLILVSVTINMALNGGLFGHAGNAAKGTKEAKAAEDDWINLKDNMATDELRAKYTTNKEEDLANLRRFFIDGDETAIPDEENSIEYVYDGGIDETHEYVIIKYNNNLYKAIWEYADIESWTSVEPITEEEAILYHSVGTINGVEYYYYKNTIYQETENGVERYNGVLVSSGDNKIAFIPKQNQTWYEWATDENDTNDLDLSDLQENLTLKKLIRYVHTQDDKTIRSFPGPIPISNNMGSEKPKVVLLLYSPEILFNLNYEEAKSTDMIIPGYCYVFGYNHNPDDK